MTTLFSVDFENGKLFDPGPSGKGFDIVSVSGGTLEVKAGAAYEGSYGLEAIPLSGYRAGGARIIHNPSSGKFRQAFWFDPNSITIPSGSYVQIGRNYHYDLSQQFYTILLGWTGSNYIIEIGMADTTLSIVTFSSSHTITDAWHLIETYWQTGTPGSHQLWIDGVNEETITANNSNNWIITPGIGCNLRSSPSVSTTGSVYFDKWRANDDGSQIGG